MSYPSKGDLIDLVNGLCLIEEKIKAKTKTIWKVN